MSIIRPSQTAAYPTFVILQSLAVADATFFKKAVQTDTQTHRHTEPINGSKFHSTSPLMLETLPSETAL